MGNNWDYRKPWIDMNSGPGFDGYGGGVVRVVEPKPKSDEWPVLKSAQEVEAEAAGGDESGN